MSILRAFDKNSKLCPKSPRLSLPFQGSVTDFRFDKSNSTSSHHCFRNGLCPFWFCRSECSNQFRYTGTRRALERASKAAGIGHISSHAFRHTYRSWLDAVKTSIAVQQKMMRHTDIRTTMNIYGDVVTDEMSTAALRVAELAFRSNGAQAERMSI